MAEKKSFVMYKNWMSIFCTLPDDKAGELIKAIYQYQNGEEVNISDVSLQAIFSLFKEKFDADNRQYELKCEVNRENGSKGGKQKVANGKQNVANGSERLRTGSVRGRNVADNDNDNDNDNDINNKRENIIKEKNVIPPKKESRRLAQRTNYDFEALRRMIE